jgi:hypothetical protein
MISFDWSSSYANGVNMKYGDCDGDGEIQFSDTLAVVNNYGLTHPAFIHNVTPFPLSGFGSELQLDLPQVLNTGVTYSIPILYGDGSLTNQDLYGTAFTLLYDENIIDPLSISLDFPPSWLANTGESINFWKNNSNTGSVDVAITRFDGINANGFGQIGILNFTVLQNANGTPQFEFVRTLALLQNQSQVTLDVTPQQSGLTVGISENSAEESKLQLYPNPANDFIQCFITGKQNSSKIEIYNSLGERMNIENDIDNIQTKIDISSFPSGIYVARLNANNRVVSKSFVKF